MMTVKETDEYLGFELVKLDHLTQTRQEMSLGPDRASLTK